MSSSDNAYMRYLWVYFPVLLMVMIRLSFDSSAFTIKLFQPWCNLRQGGFTARDTLLVNNLDKTSLETLYYAVKY
jgi:hypothetical protein